MNTKKKASPFWIVLGCIAAVFLIALFFFCKWLNGVLAEYESTQPIHIAEKAMTDYFSSASLEKPLSEFTDVSESEKARLTKYFASKYTGEFDFSTSSSDDETVAKYTVSYHQTKVASIAVKQTGETTEHGFFKYSLDSIELKLPHTFVSEIELPDGYSVLYDENTTAVRRTASGIPTESTDRMYGDVKGITLSRYEVSSYEKDAVITVKTPRGTAVEGEYDEGERVTKYPICYDERISDDMHDYIMKAIETYAIYAQDDSTFTPVIPYLDPESNLYDNIRLLDTWTVVTHDSWEFKDEELTEYCTYGGGEVISCHVKITHVLKRQWFDDYTDYIDLYVYLRKAGDKWLIYKLCQN